MPNARPETAPKSRSGTPIRVSWAGNPWSLTGLCILNIVLIVLTLGIYWFWARSEYRRRMWQMVRVNGEPLEYTGTGGELIIGYLKLFVFVMLPAFATVVAAELVLGGQEALQSHGAAGVELARADADLRPEAVAVAVGEAGGGVVVDAGGVDFPQEALGGLRVLGDDALRVARAVGVDVGDGRVQVVDDLHGEDELAVLRVPVRVRGRRQVRQQGPGAGAAQHFHARRGKGRRDGGQQGRRR